MYEKCLFFNLNSFTRLLNKRWEEEFAQVGLSASHGYLLRLVLAKPGSTQKYLAESMDLAPSTVTRFLEVLEQKGFVKRTCCSQDGRAMTVEATKKGMALSKDLERASDRLSHFLSERIGESTASELVKLLKQTQEKIETESSELKE